MKNPPQRLACVLLDANVIIFAHEANIWLSLVKNCILATGGTIAHDEAKYFKSGNRHVGIDMPSYIKAKMITEFSATTAEFGDTYRTLDTILPSPEVAALDFGEIELISIIRHDLITNSVLCSGDGLAIKALAALGFHQRAISLESLMASNSVALSPADLPWKFSAAFFDRHIAEGIALNRP